MGCLLINKQQIALNNSDNIFLFKLAENGMSFIGRLFRQKRLISEVVITFSCSII